MTLSLLVLTNCSKEPSPKEKIIGEWAFSVVPDKNIYDNQGVEEDHTVFCGGERLTFNQDQTFEINGIENGTWSYSENEINISLTEAYGCGEFPVGSLKLEIEELSETHLRLEHSYHQFSDTEYKLIKQ